jgi:hypothetical protein
MSHIPDHTHLYNMLFDKISDNTRLITNIHIIQDNKVFDITTPLYHAQQ